jgi:hypothetical protein
VRFVEFEHIISVPRIARYVNACRGDTRDAMTLYRLNLRLSQELFTVISCFEVCLLRNRIAHHEPICFFPGYEVKDTRYACQRYGLILQLFQWMQIDEAALLYGIDHINDICNQIDAL